MHFGEIARRSFIGVALAGSISAGFMVPNGMAASDLRKDIRQDRREIRRDQRKLQRDIWKHGVYSRQARRDRLELLRDRRDIRNDRRILNFGPRYRNGYGNGRWGNGR